MSSIKFWLIMSSSIAVTVGVLYFNRNCIENLFLSTSDVESLELVSRIEEACKIVTLDIKEFCEKYQHHSNLSNSSELSRCLSVISYDLDFIYSELDNIHCQNEAVKRKRKVLVEKMNAQTLIVDEWIDRVKNK